MILSDKDFEHIREGGTALVGFCIDTCPAKPMCVEFCNHYTNDKLDVVGSYSNTTDEGIEIFKEYNVTICPTFIVFQEGKTVGRRECFGSDQNIDELVEDSLA